MDQLGSHEFIALGLGDDQSTFSYFEQFDIWNRNLIDKLNKLFQSDNEHQSVSLNSVPLHGYSIDFDSNSSTITSPFPVSFEDCKHKTIGLINGYVTSNTRLTKLDWSQDIRHLVITIPWNDQLPDLYTAGDVAVVYPSNPSSLVYRALVLITKCMNQSNEYDNIIWNDEVWRQTTLHIQCHFKYKRRSRIGNISCNIFTLLSEYLDLAGRPKRSFFQSLAQYARNPEERDKLQEISSPAGTDLYFDYCVRVSIIEISIIV